MATLTQSLLTANSFSWRYEASWTFLPSMMKCLWPSLMQALCRLVQISSLVQWLSCSVPATVRSISDEMFHINLWVINMSIYRCIFIISKYVCMTVYLWECSEWLCSLEVGIEFPVARGKRSCELLTVVAENLTLALWQSNIYFYLLINLSSPKHYLKGCLMARIFSKIIVVETQMYGVAINHIVSIIKIFKSINLQRTKKYVCMCVCVMWMGMDMRICVKVQLPAMPNWKPEANFMYLPLLFFYIDFWAIVSHWT